MDSEDRSTQKDTSSSAVTSSLSDLIARLEKAQGPDRELDCRIHFALNPDQEIMLDPGTLRAFPLDRWLDWDGLCMIVGARPVTSSIDAAMTLVPEGWSRHLSEDDKNIWWIELRHGHATSYDNVIITKNKSIAVALCFAALKAHSVRDPSDSTKERALLLSKSPAEGGEM